ncbi:TetR family transcriptional regulator [Pokkaliibacter plantistimulans]|uniref:TetR family transcriptional regulator n=1 Tax=Pokkaliibacter plantistimulans TaxID=1635171 RepID=A0ABX5LW34_9GAMM|nr:TetR/AcrR family transcriptional regulator [Pokkaliibacter plantistimulans]PXF30867.1 TetR family transcriptional regulator [Pokkaliibacter plantistimulans]
MPELDNPDTAAASSATATASALPDSGWRGSAELWLQAAYDSLIEAGIDAVRIMPLAKKLNLSRTSFYWFFKDRDALLTGLLAQWRQRNTDNLIGQTQAYAESVAEAVLNVFDCWLDPQLFDAQFEFAVRSWALQSPEVAAQVAAADEARLAALRQMFERFGMDALAADVRARTVYLTQIGYISMKTSEALAIRMQRIADYVQIFTGSHAEARELQRFYARHGFQPAAEAGQGV